MPHPIMDLDDLFLNKLDDLERRCSNAPTPAGEDREYSLLMVAPLLREFLMDRKVTGPLLREHRLRLRFRCVPLSPLPEGLPKPDLHLAADGFGLPDQVNPAFVRELSIDDFLRAPVGFVRDDPVTVYDLVEYAANAAGGVHYDEREKGNRPVVRRLHEALQLQGIGAALYALRGVGVATLAALQPLAEAVRSNTQ